ncbi:unnamed protein product [Diatraea saccharalis]|uniref:Peptidase S1 domain-containing protein n=1 Tax=Diatraea saccharalis TaxID=40085 RepID=A0A9P0C3U4_9NEOP|nr:unnamed protein product [Diatraea saccharalis]
MRWLIVAAVLCVAAAAAEGERGRIRYGFYRGVGGSGVWNAEAELSTRRVFGGEATDLSVFPAVCALLDRYWSTRCSCAVVAPRWALTAAHCVSPRVSYVKYNARRPTAPDGDVAPVHYLYRHPGYKVVQEDEGRGVDVTLLHHDVGLVRSRVDMVLATPPNTDPLHTMRLYNPVDLKNEQVKVLGFGRTERSVLGEELFVVRLQLVFCERGAWFHCVCGVAAGRDPRGVCSGDSGGPVIYKGAQVGVTSMGPMECTPVSSNTIGIFDGGNSTNSTSSLIRMPPTGATSVFTSLYNYADLINATIHDTEQALRMRMLPAAAITHGSLPVAVFALTAMQLILPAR